MTTATEPRSTHATPVMRAWQVLALLTTINLAYQFVTAGRLFPGNEDAHAAGAIVLHVVSGLAAVAAVYYWYQTRTAVWYAVLAVVLFVLTFVQAATGGRDTLEYHIPGAFVLVVGSVWLTVWTLGRGRA